MARILRLLVASLAFCGLASTARAADFAARNLLNQRQWLDDLASYQDNEMMPSDSSTEFYYRPRRGRQQDNDVGNRRFSGFGDSDSADFGGFGSAFQEKPKQPIKKRIFRRPSNQRPARRQDGAVYDNFGNRQRYRPGGYRNEEQEVSRRQGSQGRFPVEPEERRRTTEPRPLRRIDLEKQAIIEDVEEEPFPAPTNQKVYKPASGPAYAPEARDVLQPLAEPRFDPIPYPEGGDYPAEQRDIQSAVLDGANSYKPDGVYQTEDRLEFQIHGHQGPHSYRYGYDTGNGYNRSFRYEERDKDGYVKGRYGYFDQYGKLKVVNYSADPYKGFKAEGAHVPF